MLREERALARARFADDLRDYLRSLKEGNVSKAALLEKIYKLESGV